MTLLRRVGGLLAAGLLLALAACSAGWHPVPAVAWDTLSGRQQVQVWRRSTVLRWHRVRVSSTTLSGVPYLQPAACDSCRITVARSSVDSVRLGDPAAGLWKSVSLLGVAALTAWCLRGGCEKGGT